MAKREAKLQALFMCDKVVQPGDGRVDAIKIWHNERVVTFPYTTRLSFVALFKGDFSPTSISIAILDPDTREQLLREVDELPPDPLGRRRTVWASQSPELTFTAPGRYELRIDADGISPASFEFELIAARK